MKLAVRASKIDAVKLQLLLSLELEEVNIVASPTKYDGITILDVDESTVSSLSSIRNIEPLLLDEVTAAELQQPSTASVAPSFNKLDDVDERERLSFLANYSTFRKQRETKDEILRN